MNTDGKHEVDENNGEMEKTMLGDLHTTDSLTISSRQCKTTRARRDRDAYHAWTLGTSDPKTLCLQGGDVHKMVGSSGTIHSLTNCSIPCGTAWASRDRWPRRARTPGAPDPQNLNRRKHRPLKASLASYFTRSKPKTSEMSLFTSILLSLLR